MKEKFDNELKELKKSVEEMGNLAIGMLEDSLKALAEQNTTLAEDVISRKKALVNMDGEIEDKALKLIALYQPMAKDMRAIACVLKMITYLARIGKYGKDISYIVQILIDEPEIARIGNIQYMGKLTLGMVVDVIESFKTGNLLLIEKFNVRDDEVDDLMVSVIRECLTYMMEDPRNITRCTRYIMVAKYLERCGDHACKAAEKIHYMVTGNRIEIK